MRYWKMEEEAAKKEALEESTKKIQAAMWAKLLKQLGASVFFGVSSILIITVNKTVLTTYR